MKAQFILVADVQKRAAELLRSRAQPEVREGVCGVGLGSSSAVGKDSSL